MLLVFLAGLLLSEVFREERGFGLGLLQLPTTHDVFLFPCGVMRGDIEWPLYRYLGPDGGAVDGRWVVVAVRVRAAAVAVGDNDLGAPYDVVAEEGRPPLNALGAGGCLAECLVVGVSGPHLGSKRLFKKSR